MVRVRSSSRMVRRVSGWSPSRRAVARMMAPHLGGRRFERIAGGQVSQARTRRSRGFVRLVAAHLWATVRLLNSRLIIVKMRPDRSQAW